MRKIFVDSPAIVAKMLRLGLSKREVAERAGLSLKTFSRICNGDRRTVHVQTAARLVAIFGEEVVSIDGRKLKGAVVA